MSKPKEKIAIVVESISFTFFSIVYKVKLQNNKKLGSPEPFYFNNNVKDKDLLLKPTLLDENNMEVICTPNNVTPHYYEAIISKTISDYDEYITELNSIYVTGEVIGYVLI